MERLFWSSFQMSTIIDEDFIFLVFLRNEWHISISWISRIREKILTLLDHFFWRNFCLHTIYKYYTYIMGKKKEKENASL